MNDNRLKIVAVDSSKAKESKRDYAGGKNRRLEAQVIYDHLWQTDPMHLSPLRNIMERTRLERTHALVNSELSLEGKRAVDLGCGNGIFALRLAENGAQVDTVDISQKALQLVKELKNEGLTPLHDYVPMTKLHDNSYDLVVCTELIAYLKQDEYRLLFSELARIVKNDGFIVCSTALDINSEGALERFAGLAETEIETLRWTISYHRCWIRIKELFEAPARFVRASQDIEYKERELKSLKPLAQSWFRMNSQVPFVYFWSLLKFLLSPFLSFIKTNKAFLLRLERICKFFWGEAGISHAMLIGKRRPLFIELPPNERPKEHKHKKQVWE